MRRWSRFVVGFTLIAVSALTVGALAGPPGRTDGAAARFPLPKGFRSWTHIKSMAVEDRDYGMYGFHNVYANGEAVRVIRAPLPHRYPTGATFVVSIFEIEKKDGAVRAGAKRREVVQIKDPTAAATGGWRFAAFDPAGKPIAIDAAGCFSCHAAAARVKDAVLATFTE